jgi:hypothetical protein
VGAGTTNRVVTSSIDAISEVKAYATGMPAEFDTQRGALAAVFRSTNQFHGSLRPIPEQHAAASRLLRYHPAAA